MVAGRVVGPSAVDRREVGCTAATAEATAVAAAGAANKVRVNLGVA